MSCISTKGIYGLAAMVELAVLGFERNRQIKDIAKSANIPQNYLEQILGILRKNGLLESTRGANGGYKLARPPQQITCLEILECLEGEFLFASKDIDNSTLEHFFSQVDESMKTALAKSLHELAEHRQRSCAGHIYYI